MIEDEALGALFRRLLWSRESWISAASRRSDGEPPCIQMMGHVALTDEEYDLLKRVHLSPEAWALDDARTFDTLAARDDDVTLHELADESVTFDD